MEDGRLVSRKTSKTIGANVPARLDSPDHSNLEEILVTCLKSAGKAPRALFGLVLPMVIGFSTSTSALVATGVVKSSKDGSVIQGVAVTEIGGTGRATSDNNGAFTVQSQTSILPSERTQGFGMTFEGNRLVVTSISEGLIEARILTATGSILWNASASASNGGVSFSPNLLANYRGTAFLYVAQGNRQLTSSVVLTEGISSASSPALAFAGRSAVTYPTLSFSKTGYKDTTFVLTSYDQKGIAVVIRDTTPAGPTACTLPPSPSPGSGSFTNYWFGQGSYKEDGFYRTACGHRGTENSGQSSDMMNNIANPGYFVAIPGNSPDDFNTNGMCGACVELSGQNGTKVIATVTDECPVNGQNAPCKSNFNGHLDVSYPAFSKLGFGVGNPSGTSWKYVKCPVTGNIIVRIKKGNSDQIYVENTILPIKDVKVGSNSGTHLTYGAWKVSRNALGATLTIVDYSDRSITVKIPTTAGLDTDYNTGVQFPGCL